nr:PREDICTED: uncharacterized protein LOC105662713 [Megachile rotundata]
MNCTADNATHYADCLISSPSPVRKINCPVISGGDKDQFVDYDQRLHPRCQNSYANDVLSRTIRHFTNRLTTTQMKQVSKDVSLVFELEVVLPRRSTAILLLRTIFQKLKNATLDYLTPLHKQGFNPFHVSCRSIDMFSRPFCGWSLDGGPIPARNVQIFKVEE